ncbi:hypothetical protein ACROYT_G027395 [Oculina patagonica]
MVWRKLRRGFLLLIPIYVCLVFIGFFSFIWSSAKTSYVQQSIAELKVVFNEPVSLGNVCFNSSNIPGVLNLHVWNDLCGLDVDRLRETPLFPRYPHERLFLRNFQTVRNFDSYGQRIFGFIEPKVSGLYTFAVSSDDSSELWLSFDENPHNLRLIASVFSPRESAWTDENDFSKYPTQQSRNIRLVAHKRYFVEALHKQGAGNGRIQVYWRKPGSLKLETITGDYLSSYFDDRKLYTKQIDEEGFEALTWTPSHVKQSKYKGLDLSSQFNYTALPFIDRNVLKGILKSCSYKPSYIIERNLSRYEGVNLVHSSFVYPVDNTYLNEANSLWSEGNKLVDNQTVDDIVGKFMDNFQISQRRYYLQRIINVEQNPDPKKGNRFLLELQLGHHGSNESFRLSEYVFVSNGTDELCFPEGMEWRRNATIYFILPVKNQGKWVHHFASQLANMSRQTGDFGFHVVIVDFDSEDIDIDKVFSVWPLQDRYTLIKLNGSFHKTLALQKAVEAVPNDQDIVFLFDLHIDVPIGLLDSVRKHTILGKVAYAPAVARLECGEFPSDPHGYWQENGYGILGVFKKDWDRFGGMNVKDFTTKWGGEDWDLIDRVFSAQLEIERLKQPGLFHYYHSHAGMWQ